VTATAAGDTHTHIHTVKGNITVRGHAHKFEKKNQISFLFNFISLR